MTSAATPGQIPRSIHLFERLQITALAVGWVNAAVTYRSLLRARLNPYLFGMVLILISVAVVLLIHRISRRHSATGVWILVAISGLFVVPWLVLVRHLGVGSLTGLLLIFQGLLQAASLALLGTHDSRLWIDER